MKIDAPLKQKPLFQVQGVLISSPFSQLSKVLHPGAVCIVILRFFDFCESPLAPQMGLFGVPFGSI